MNHRIAIASELMSRKRRSVIELNGSRIVNIRYNRGARTNFVWLRGVYTLVVCITDISTITGSTFTSAAISTTLLSSAIVGPTTGKARTEGKSASSTR